MVGRSLNYATVQSNPCMVLKRKETFSLLSEGRGRAVKKKGFVVVIIIVCFFTGFDNRQRKPPVRWKGIPGEDQLGGQEPP